MSQRELLLNRLSLWKYHKRCLDSLTKRQPMSVSVQYASSPAGVPTASQCATTPDSWQHSHKRLLWVRRLRCSTVLCDTGARPPQFLTNGRDSERRANQCGPVLLPWAQTPFESMAFHYGGTQAHLSGAGLTPDTWHMLTWEATRVQVWINGSMPHFNALLHFFFFFCLALTFSLLFFVVVVFCWSPDNVSA